MPVVLSEAKNLWMILGSMHLIGNQRCFAPLNMTAHTIWLGAESNRRHVDFQSNQNAMPNKPTDRKLAKGPNSVRSANPARV
jgi:hypothetical protein